MIDLKYLAGICVLLFGGTLWMVQSVFNVKDEAREKGLRMLLVGACLLSLAFYTRFGSFHVLPDYGPQNFHQAEVYTYYMGSKYFRETGCYDLYNFTSIAMQEMKDENSIERIPKLFPIMNLRTKRSYLTPEAVGANYRDDCRRRFSPERWEAFKRDLRVFFRTGSYDRWWRTTLSDMGYNSSPIFASLAGPIANLLPIEFIWRLAGYFDFLLVALAAFVIYRSFGLYPLLGFLMVFGSNSLSSYLWTGGSFLRQTWFVSLAIGLGLLQQKQYYWAGAVLAYSTGDRAFPILFVVGAAIPMAYDWIQSKGTKRQLIPFAAGFAISGCLLLALSLLLYGPGSWRDFFANMKVHNGAFWIPHVGLTKVFSYFDGIHPQDFWFQEGLNRFYAWNQTLHEVLNSRKILYVPVALLLTLGSMRIARRKSPALASVLVGGSLLYAFFLPARYYYVYLALFPVVAYAFPATLHDHVRNALSFLLIFALLVIPIIPPDDILLNIYFSWALGIFFLLQVVNGFLEEYRETAVPSPRSPERLVKERETH